MERARTDRRLAAISAADMVGYGRLMEADNVSDGLHSKRLPTGRRESQAKLAGWLVVSATALLPNSPSRQCAQSVPHRSAWCVRDHSKFSRPRVSIGMAEVRECDACRHQLNARA